MSQVSFILSSDEFRTFLLDQNGSAAKLLLCFFRHQSQEAERIIQLVNAELTRKVNLKVTAAAWDITEFSDARQLLGMGDDITIYVVYRSQIADRLESVSNILSSLPAMMDRIEAVTSNNSVATVSGKGSDQAPKGVSVDVAKMVQMGKDLMSKSQPLYAEKFFLKACSVLDAVKSDLGSDEDVNGSLAMCLAWALMAQLVQSKNAESNEIARRLETSSELSCFVHEPLSDACRAMTVRALCRYAPATWRSDTCSVSKLSEVLKGNPHDHTARSMLVITMFLSGDVERAVTEALKLHVLNVDFGRIALNAITSFLGENHSLVLQSGWKPQ